MLPSRLLAKSPYSILTGLLLLVLAVVVALTYDRYGFTTDEAIDYLKAVRVVTFIVSLGGDSKEISKIDEINIYGAMPDVIALVLQRLIPALSFDSRHLVSALFGVGGVYYAYRLGSAFVSPAVGFFTALILASNPMWFGYMFFNTKDIPFAATLLAAFYYCLCALTEKDRARSIWIKAGLATGFLASTKLIGILVLGLMVVETLTVFSLESAQLRIDRTLFGRLLKTALSAAVGSLVCFLAFWPQFFLWSPAQLVSIVGQFMNYENWHSNVLIGGQYFFAQQVPWYYMLTYFSVSMPLLSLALTGAGAIYGVLRPNGLVLSCIIASVSFFFYQALTQAHVAYNGYRHFLFLLPITTIIAAYPVGCIFTFRFPLIVRAVTLTFVIVGTSATAASMYQLFPYQYSFFNVLVGGLPGADGKYEIDVWRSALREALEQIERLSDPNRIISVGTCGSSMNFAVHPNLRWAGEANDSDYIVILRRCLDTGSHIPDWPLVGEVRRDGVMLAAIYSRPKM